MAILGIMLQGCLYLYFNHCFIQYYNYRTHTERAEKGGGEEGYMEKIPKLVLLNIYEFKQGLDTVQPPFLK